MKKFYPALIFMVTALLCTSCKKENIFRIDLSEYTHTDSTCLITGKTDNSDWIRDAEWTAREISFLNFDDQISTSDSATGFVQISPVCPNPNDGFFKLQVNTERRCIMKIACINSELETLFFSASECAGGPIKNTYDLRGLSSFHKNENYRMYYGFFNAKDSIYYKGHGDFRIE